MLFALDPTSEVRKYNFKCEFNLDEPPPWASGVSRWYQLDGAGFALASAYWEFKDQLSTPQMIFMTSTQGSNISDNKFCVSGGNSPARFVHTLASVRMTPLLQLMKKNLPVICLQKGPESDQVALQTATMYRRVNSNETVWVIAIQWVGDQSYEVDISVLGAESGV